MMKLHPFKSLLHFVDQHGIDELTALDISANEEEWLTQVSKSGSLLQKYYRDEERLLQSINALRSNLKEEKILFSNKAILAFIADWKWNENVIDECSSLISDIDASIWLQEAIADGVANNYFYRFLEKGFLNVEEAIKIERLYLQLGDNIKIKVRDKFEDLFQTYEKSVSESIQSPTKKSLLSNDFTDTFTTHQKLVLEALPFDSKAYLSRYGHLLEEVVKNYSSQISKGQLSIADMEKISSMANLGAKILGKEELKEVAKVIQTKMNHRKSNKNVSRQITKIAGGIIALLILGVGGWYLYQFLQDETSTKEEQYVAYLERYREFSENRRISQELIEQRKNVEITDSYQYGERDNVPLFYTYLKTNKYLSINEINEEVYRLRRFINTDGIDTDKIFVQVHFFIHDKDNPYRFVMAEFPVRDRYGEVKQVAKNRATASFKIENSSTSEPYKLVIELKESFSSGIIEISLLEILFDPAQDLVEIYTYNPMPSLAHSMSLDEFLILSANPDNMDELYMAVAANKIYNLPSGQTFRYRLPVDIENKSIASGLPALNGMINWELTTFDDMAFIRIRSDEISGYYLVDRNVGKPIQSYASFPEDKKVSREFFIQYVSL